MPDHVHFLWLGWSESSDQKRAIALFREAWNLELLRGGRELQRQAYDEVLREAQRDRGAFGTVANYIFENPVRAGLVEDWRSYFFSWCARTGLSEDGSARREFLGAIMADLRATGGWTHG